MSLEGANGPTVCYCCFEPDPNRTHLTHFPRECLRALSWKIKRMEALYARTVGSKDDSDRGENTLS